MEPDGTTRPQAVIASQGAVESTDRYTEEARNVDHQNWSKRWGAGPHPREQDQKRILLARTVVAERGWLAAGTH